MGDGWDEEVDASMHACIQNYFKLVHTAEAFVGRLLFPKCQSGLCVLL